jgi:hypothetical protein
MDPAPDARSGLKSCGRQRELAVENVLDRRRRGGYASRNHTAIRSWVEPIMA